jgi:hypothetical protein
MQNSIAQALLYKYRLGYEVFSFVKKKQQLHDYFYVIAFSILKHVPCHVLLLKISPSCCVRYLLTYKVTDLEGVIVFWVGTTF